MNTLKEALMLFDNPEKKHFHYFDVSNAIAQLPEEITTSFEAQAEYLAMSFQDNTGEKHWNTYLGPMSTWVRKDTGEEVLQPDISFIKPEHITYWERRASETANPLMSMRYTGLVLDFKKKVTGDNPDYRTIILPYIKAVIKCVEDDYVVHEVEGYFKMERALQMSASINNTQLFEKAQQVLWDYDQKHGKDESPGLWGRHFKIMIIYQERYGRFEETLVKENEERFNRIESQALLDGGKTDRFAHILGEETDLLCEYYHKKCDNLKIKEYLDRELVVIKKSFDLRGGMWAHSMLQTMQSKYRKYHFYNEANKLYIDIQDWGKKALAQMQVHEFSVPIDNEQLEVYLNDFLSGTPREVFMKYLVRNIPNQDVERQRQKEEAEQSPLLDMTRTTTYDINGSPINNVGVGEDSEYQKLMYGMYRRMLITAIFLRLEVTKMIEQGKLSLEIVLDSFKGSPLIAEEQYGLFERGMKAYFEEDYIVACHLLIPQFESAIRRMVAMCGGEILQSDRDPKDGNRYISLDGLLDSEEAKNGLKEDVQTYFKNLFTEHNGWNLRNLTSHGLLQTSGFDSTVADRIVHAFVLLSQLEFTEK